MRRSSASSKSRVESVEKDVEIGVGDSVGKNREVRVGIELENGTRR